MKKLIDKSLIEQIREAEKHTTEAKAKNKIGLAQTAYDHLVRCGTPPDKRMWEHPNTPLVDLMSEKEIEQRVERCYRVIEGSNYSREDYEKMVQLQIQEDSRFKDPLTEIVLFLSEIGKLPQRYQHIIPKPNEGEKK